MLETTIKAIVLEWLSIVSSMGSVANVAGNPPAVDPSSCQNTRRVLSFPTRVGLIRQSSRAISATFWPAFGISSSTGTVMGSIVPLNKESLS